MTSADTGSKLSAEAMLQRGKMALESLQFREEAARIHSARLDLQAALVDAESGNPDRLQNWLNQYQSLLDHVDGHAIRNSVESKSYDLATMKSSTMNSLRVDVPNAPVHELVSTDIVSHDIVRIEPEAVDQSNAEETEPDFPLAKKSPWDSMMQAALAREQAVAKADPMVKSVVESDERIDGNFDEPIDTPIDDAPIIIPETVRLAVTEPKEPESKLKKLLWLSPALIWSTAAHVVALVGMSAYVISMATRTEPMAIVSSPVDTETVSMETPAEMTATDLPEVEPTTMSTPNLPTVATPMASVSTSSMALPTTVTGDAPGDMPSALGSAIGDAVGSAMNAIPATTGAQFFGVNATGNSFCYIVDRSGSMKGGAFESAKEEIVRSLSTMKPKQRFYIFFFGEDIEGLKLNGRDEETYPVYATKENIQKTIQWMDRVKIQSGKHPAEVISRAIEMEPDGIFLLFDGETSVDLAPRIKKANLVYDVILGEQTRVPIHSVCFYTEDPAAQKLMKTIADQNLGTYRYIAKPPSAGGGKRRAP